MHEEGHEGEIEDFIGILIGDVIRAIDGVQSNDSAYNRRVAVRVVFSAIEGLLWMLKQGLNGQAERRPDFFTLADRALLREEAYTVDERGSPRTRPLFMPLAENIKFTIRMLKKHPMAAEYDPKLDHAGWRNLRESLRVRHRLTHPKTEDDLKVSRDEVIQATSGFYWFLAHALRFRQALVDILESDVAAIQRMVAQAAERRDRERTAPASALGSDRPPHAT